MDKMTNFLKNFFGPGTEGYQFPYFSIPHFIPIIIMLLMIYIMYKYKSYIQYNNLLDMRLRAWIGFTLALANASWYWHAIYVGTDVSVALPLTLCETVMFLAVFLLFTKNQYMFDVLYFWAICGTTNALLTPAVLDNYGPTKFKYYQFWIGHCGIFIAIFYCIFILKMRVNFKSLLRSFTWLLLMGLVSVYVNSNIEGANYLFLSGSAAGDSVLDILPTNVPIRFALMSVVMFTLFILAYLPWYLSDKKSIVFSTKQIIESNI
jgi:hypothetical integral membrane protein (TIGR02206 family)